MLCEHRKRLLDSEWLHRADTGGLLYGLLRAYATANMGRKCRFGRICPFAPFASAFKGVYNSVSL